MAKQTMKQANGQERKQGEKVAERREFRWSDAGKKTADRQESRQGAKTASKQRGKAEGNWSKNSNGRQSSREEGKWAGKQVAKDGMRQDRKRSEHQDSATRTERAARPERPMRGERQDRGYQDKRRLDRDKNQTGYMDKTTNRLGTKQQGKSANGANKCPYAKKCGGCMFQGIDYAEQLRKKQGHVIYLLKEFGKVHDIIGMEDPYHYRNKVHAVFDRTKTGTIISGVYEEKSHRVVAIEECQIENKLADSIIGSIRDLCKSFKIRIYDEDTGYGLLRHVLIRTGHESGQVMVVMVLASPILPSKNNFVKALRKLHPEISTIVLNINERQTNMVLGERDIVLYGKGYIEDSLCGNVFRISPQSFYQVNPVQTEVLYNKAIELAGLTGKERVIDAYCGTGTIGIIASKQAKEVIGVELNKDAIRDASTNAKRNDVKNIKFYNQDAGKFMMGMAEEGESADVVFMDPPRTGSSNEFLSSVVKLAPKKIVYVSCNPETLARDLKFLEKQGYVGKDIYPVDMFPFTGHVETVVKLVRNE